MDSKLTLKPIELLDIGIDKLTKIPIPILNDNVTSEYDNDNGIPIDSFYIQFNSNYSNSTLLIELSAPTFPTSLTFDFGDGTTEQHTISLPFIYQHIYSTTDIFDIRIFGDLNKIERFYVSPSGTTGGVMSASISNLKYLKEFAIPNSLLTTINIEKLIYLENINLYNNYLSNSEIDNVFIIADTFMTTDGTINISGVNNGKPSVYSLYSRNDLISSNKRWLLNYNI
jgi:hypothetical protein